jgi:predicted nucleic acid-binding protein
VTFLLDVNALLGVGQVQHSHHIAAMRWIKSLDPRSSSLATCSISELGFIRILTLPQTADLTIAEAINALRRVKNTSPVPFRFISDNVGGDILPSWVARSGQTTDGHLLSLARSIQGQLATFDKSIPGAFLIPD